MGGGVDAKLVINQTLVALTRLVMIMTVPSLRRALIVAVLGGR